MKRLIVEQLLAWKQQQHRKPILLDGARQTGKSYVLYELFGKPHFKQVFTLDMLISEHRDVFSDIDPDNILQRVSILNERIFDENNDLLIIDEIGEHQPAMDALKLFSQQKPQLFIAASGSNIGLLGSYPVGKVQELTMRPMCFEEFLMAGGNQALIQAFQNLNRDKTTYTQLDKVFKEYLFVGGLPEVVATWYKTPKDQMQQRIDNVERILKELNNGYQRDTHKYAGRFDGKLIESVFNNISTQMHKADDYSVKRFRFADVNDKKPKYTQLKNSIDWLLKSKLCSKNNIVENPIPPLPIRRKNNTFKLFPHDIGLARFKMQLNYFDVLRQEFSYKGYFAECFVNNELLCFGLDETYSFNAKNHEIEFILSDPLGGVIPLEVKSGKNTRAKSLTYFKEHFSPKRTIKLIGSAGGTKDEHNIVMPLFYIQPLLAQLQRQAYES